MPPFWKKKTPAPEPPPPLLSPAEQEIRRAIDRYSWYHEIEFAPNVRSRPDLPELRPIWRFIENSIGDLDFRGKRVLDIGCRDGLFSLLAERRGAAEILAIDNNLSRGFTEFLIPHFHSSIQTAETNLYDLDPARHGGRDIIMFFGVLYHLRYPNWGLKKIIDCLRDDGILLLETGICRFPAGEHLDLLHCPVEESPYEATSCTFYNRKGLLTTMRSLGMTPRSHFALESNIVASADRSVLVAREFFSFTRTPIGADTIGRNIYWDKTHNYHTDQVRPK